MSAALARADNSTGRHRNLRANCFESHTRVDATDIHPDQPIPDQPPPDSQFLRWLVVGRVSGRMNRERDGVPLPGMLADRLVVVMMFL